MLLRLEDCDPCGRVTCLIQQNTVENTKNNFDESKLTLADLDFPSYLIFPFPAPPCLLGPYYWIFTTAKSYYLLFADAISPAKSRLLRWNLI